MNFDYSERQELRWGFTLTQQLKPGKAERRLVNRANDQPFGQITFSGGQVEQQNFPDFDSLRMSGAPMLETRMLSNNPHLGGGGEPGTPPAAAALANALFDLTGVRARALPLETQFDFVL